MTTSSARSAISASALVIVGLYFYRRFTETASAEEVATSGLISLPRFAAGFGVTFMVLALLSGPLPSLAGNMALLIVLASLLSNGVQVSKDLQKGLKETRAEREGKLHPSAARASGHRTAPSATTISEAKGETV